MEEPYVELRPQKTLSPRTSRYAGGGWFTDHEKQGAIISLLSVAKENGWPTQSVVESLKETWSMAAEV